MDSFIRHPFLSIMLCQMYVEFGLFIVYITSSINYFGNNFLCVHVE